jgi:hypothetical protein
METLALLLARHLSGSRFEMVLKGTIELSASMPPIGYHALLVSSKLVYNVETSWQGAYWYPIRSVK